MRIILLASLILAIVGCKSSQTGNPSRTQLFYITDFLSNWNHSSQNYSFRLNESNTLVLCVRSTTERPAVIDYTVYDISSEKALFSSGLIGGEVFWYSDAELAIRGVSRIEPEQVTLVNARNGESRLAPKKSIDEIKNK